MYNTRPQASQDFKRAIIATLEADHGFFSEGCLKTAEHVDEWRLRLVLVRCGSGRFLCPLQDARHFVGIITREKGDYVRDVSIPATGSPMCQWPEVNLSW